MEPLKSTQLRLGNFIMSGNNGKFDHDGQIGKVLEIGNEEREFEQIYCECEESFEWFFKDNYFGIPLTKDWLVKLGFELKEDEYYEFNKHRVYLINNSFEFEFTFYDNLRVNFFRNYNYVHELQNLYYSITLEELAISF